MQTKRIRARSDHLSELPSVILASEPMDDDDDWRQLEAGELVHIDADLNISSVIALTDPPAHQLLLADVSPEAARAQHDQKAS